MSYIERKRIFVPSTLRLLRLINGKECERGEECCEYNLVTRRSRSLSKVVERPFGLMLCKACVDCLSSPIYRYSYDYWCCSRVATVDFSKVICNHFQEIATEEDVGPLVLVKHVKQIEATYTSNAARAEHIQTILDTFDINQISQEDRDRALVLGFASVYFFDDQFLFLIS